MSRLTQTITETIAASMDRSMATSVSRWSERYRVVGEPIPGKWTHTYHPWLIDMADADEPNIIGQKAAQMGFSEWAINTAFYYIDMHHRDVLYVLPSHSDAIDFTAARFDPALMMSEHIQRMFSSVNNVTLKTGPFGKLYVRGSHSESKLKSIPVSVVILDEVDEMPQRSVELARRRMSGQMFSKELNISTPTYPGEGINAAYELSTKDQYWFNCPHCDKPIVLSFPDSLIKCGTDIHDPDINKSHFICTECKKELPVFARFWSEQANKEITEPYDGSQRGAKLYKPWLAHKTKGGTGRMISEHPNRERRGFHVNCMYSPAIAGCPYSLTKNLFLAEMSDEKKQEVYNSDLGLPVQVEGAKVTDLDIQNCVKRLDQGSRIRTMGFDVGSLFHVTIKEWFPIQGAAPSNKINDKYFPRMIFHDELTSWDECWQAFEDHGCLSCVLDKEPEGHAALEFARRCWGKIFLCDYNYHHRGKTVTYDKVDQTIFANRTAWLDQVLGRIRNQRILLPEVRHFNYDKHIKALTRTIKKNNQTQQKYAAYTNNGNDHFAHSDVYSELALPFALQTNKAWDIVDLF